MSGKTSSTTKKAEPGIPGTGTMRTQPAFIGDNQNMLAQQLAAGGYGAAPDLMAMLGQTFTPMQVLDTRPGANPTPTTPTTPTTSGPGLAKLGALASLFGQFGDGNFDLRSMLGGGGTGFGGFGGTGGTSGGGQTGAEYYGNYKGNPPK